MPTILDLPARTAVRLVALSHLRAAAVAVGRGEADGLGTEQVHRFRLSLRRLRTVVRAFGPQLEGSLKRGDLRRLRLLLRTSAEFRDLDVRAAWLTQPTGEVEREESLARDWLLRRMWQRRKEVEQALRVAVEKQLPKLVRRFEKRLGRYTVRVEDGAPRPPLFASALEDRLRSGGTRLDRRLSRLASRQGRDAVHRARLDAKRLRHLLEPIAEDAPEAAALLTQLKELQSLLGDLHDGALLHAVVTEAIGECPADAAELARGLQILAERLDSQREIAFGELRGRWLGPGQKPLQAGLEGVLRFLRAWAEAGVEVERKYLLRALPTLPGETPVLEIRQGWLPGEQLLERLRHVRSTDGERWVRTVKLGFGARRLEIEEETAEEVFNSLWPLTEGRRVAKQRYRVEEGGYVWEIDHFPDRDLVLAEVEVASEAEDPALPAWLAPVLDREVTGEAEYVNLNLAR
jgi:CHAD domain-containing protein/CYTH domain-containing protein